MDDREREKFIQEFVKEFMGRFERDIIPRLAEEISRRLGGEFEERTKKLVVEGIIFKKIAEALKPAP